MTDKTALAVENLKVIFPGPAGVVRAVEGVSLEVREGECAAIVGESGSGKSVTSLAVMKLLETPPAVVRADRLEFEGRDLLPLSEREMQNIRGSEMAMIFQDALTALNPVMTVGRQLDEVFRRHRHMNRREAKQASIEALRLVGVPSPERRYGDFPHELSGGMRQRVLIAMAFACNPKLIIADEPTTALDVTIQAQILELINKLKRERNLSIIFITHDLGVVANMADNIAVMYAGKIVEYGTANDIFYDPRHPYTWALLSSMPDLDTKEKLESIPGTPPNMIYPPQGDAFADRNKYAMKIDFEQQPPMFKVSETHSAATWLLHPDAPKVEMPKIISARIERMKAEVE